MMFTYKIRKIFYYKRIGYSYSEIITKMLSIGLGGIPQKRLKNYLCVNLYYKLLLVKRCFLKAGKSKERAGILVLENGVLGDILVELGSLQKLYEYTRSTNESLTIVCSSSVANILKEYGGLKACEYLTFLDRGAITAIELRKIERALWKKEYTYLLRRDAHILGMYVARLANAKEKLFYSYYLQQLSKKQQKINQKLFTDIKNYEFGDFIPSIWKAMLLKIGVKEYATCQGRLIEKIPPKIGGGGYILLSPEASSRSRSLEIELCDDIIGYLQEKTRDTIKITARGDDRSYLEKLRSLAKRRDVELLDYLTMEELFLEVSQAKALIGCDSGTLHLAAAWNVPSICIAGRQETGIFVPYQYEEKRQDEHEPLFIQMEKLSCENCAKKGAFANLNSACSKRVSRGSSMYCISQIDMERVKRAVDRILGGER
jgi:ADP-heptose:LPS heptosyltransferase